VNYTELHWIDRKTVREQYVREQKHLCYYCGESLLEEPPNKILVKKINWKLFPPNVLQYPIHLQHCNKTGMTEGAVHALCNAVMWQYDNR